MTALSLANLGGGPLVQEAMRPGKGGTGSVSAFEDALSRQALQPPPAADPTAVQSPSAVTSVQSAAHVSPAGAAQSADSTKVSTTPVDGTAERERVRRSLELDGPPVSTNTTGDTILGGMQKLRGVFDAHHAHINDIMKSDMSNTQGLMAMQMEMAQYTVMVDVSSKLTGKASSSLDTLMKGQ